MEQNTKNIILHCGTNDINDESQLQIVAKETIAMIKSTIKNVKTVIQLSLVLFVDMVS